MAAFSFLCLVAALVLRGVAIATNDTDSEYGKWIGRERPAGLLGRARIVTFYAHERPDEKLARHAVHNLNYFTSLCDLGLSFCSVRLSQPRGLLCDTFSVDSQPAICNSRHSSIICIKDKSPSRPRSGDGQRREAWRGAVGRC